MASVPAGANRPKLKRSTGSLDGHGAGRRQHDRLGRLPAAVRAGRHAGPIALLGLGVHRRRRDPAGTRVRRTSAGPIPAPADRTPTRAAPSATSSASRRRGATGSPPGPATPRSRSSFVSYLSVFWPSLATNNAARLRAGGSSVIWVLTLVNMRGRARVRQCAGRHHRARSSCRWLLIGVDRAVLHQRRQLHAASTPPRQPGGPLPRDLVRGHADAVGVHRAGVGHRAGRGGQGPRAHDPARDDLRHRSPRRSLYIIATVAIMGVIPSAKLADSPARSPTPPGRCSAARCSGFTQQADRRCRDDLDLRRAQRLDPDPGARPAGRRAGRPVPRGSSRRSAACARRRSSAWSSRRCCVTGLMLMNYTKASLTDTFTVHHPARDADHAGALRVLGSGTADVAVQRARELHRAPGGARRDHRDRSPSPTRSGRSPARARTYIAQGFLLLLAGIPVYVYIKWRQRQERRRGRSGHPPAYRRRPSPADARDGGWMTADQSPPPHAHHPGERSALTSGSRGRRAAAGDAAPARNSS